MCLAVPRKIIQVKDEKALLQDNRWVRLDLVPQAAAGDYVIVSADLAVEKITKEQAEEMSRLIHE
jgi:hydrogenase expression/formation protein HypC